MAKRRKNDGSPAPLPAVELPGDSNESRPRAVMETRVFKSGNSYAVRLPKPLYAGGEGAVYVRKLANDSLLISPLRKRAWPSGFFDSFGALPEDFEAPARPAASTDGERRAASRFSDR